MFVAMTSTLEQCSLVWVPFVSASVVYWTSIAMGWIHESKNTLYWRPPKAIWYLRLGLWYSVFAYVTMVICKRMHWHLYFCLLHFNVVVGLFLYKRKNKFPLRLFLHHSVVFLFCIVVLICLLWRNKKMSMERFIDKHKVRRKSHIDKL